MYGHGRLSLVALLCLAFGCSKKAEEKPAPAEPLKTAPSSVNPSPSPTASAAASSKPSLTEPAVRELVNQWTAAQSSNDFATYEQLYAERFTGIKRAGNYTARLDRKGWMADRKTMIAPGLVVTAEELKIEVADAAATAHFKQHYKSARYEDVGPKQLVVVPTPAGPRIAREEMLSSTIQMQATGSSLASKLHAAESRGVFLVSGLPETAGKGKPVLGKPEYLDTSEADAEADLDALSDAQKSIVGRPFTVFDAAGKPCSAVVKSLSVKALVTPHFGILQSFDDKTEYPDQAVAAQKKAETFYDLAGTAGRYLYGHFEKPCPGARWAIAGTPPDVIGKTASGAERLAALTALRALPEYKGIQKRFAEDVPDEKSKPWESHDGKVTAETFRPPNRPPFLLLAAHGGAGCGDFWGSLMAIFDVTDPAHPVSRGLVDDSPAFPQILAALDLDGDGELEFITGSTDEAEAFDVIRLRRPGLYVRERFFSVPYLDCPC